MSDTRKQTPMVLVLSVALFVLLLAVAPFGSASAEQCETPLPDDIDIQAPAADVPPEQAKYSGHWGNGSWDGDFCNTLIVETIDSSGKAKVIYGWGTPSHRKFKEGFVRVKAKFSGDKLKMWFTGSREAQYQLDGDKLKGKFYSRYGVGTTTLTRK